MRLWKSRNRLSEIKTPEAYSVTLIKNLSLNHIRNQVNKRTSSYDYELPSEELLTSEISNVDSVNILMKIIEGLPNQQSEVLKLRDVEGYSYQEIARELELTLDHLRVILSRARKEVRLQFEKIDKTWI